MKQRTEWRDVVGFKGLYEVSNKGQVRAISGKIRRSFANTKGHLRIDLYKNGRAKKYVHHLVLEAFVGPRPSGMECCHRDGNPTNNNIRNLRWGTASENYEDARKHGTAYLGDSHHWTKVSKDDAIVIRKLRSVGLLQKEIAGYFNVCQQAISYILRRPT